MTAESAQSQSNYDQRFAYPGRQLHFVKHGGHRTDGDHILSADYVVVDVETSGLEPSKGARVIEFAAIRLKPNGQVVDSFHTLVNPTDGKVGLTNLHGISESMIQDAPTFAEITDHVKAIFSEAIFVAHHALFDERFVANEFMLAGKQLNTMPGLCTYWLSREVHQVNDEFPNHKLETLTKRYKLDPGIAHSAFSDAMVVAKMLPLMLRTFGEHRHFASPVQQFFTTPNLGVLRPRTLSLFD